MRGWQPIDTAPKTNERSLYLARFDDAGKLQELDFDGTWQSESESWEMPQVYYYWASANGIEEPTHWAYQDEPLTSAVDWVPMTFFGKPVLVHPDIKLEAMHALLVATLREFFDSKNLGEKTR